MLGWKDSSQGCLSMAPFTQAFINNSHLYIGTSKLNKVTHKLPNQINLSGKCSDVNLVPSAGGTLVHLPTHTTISDSGEEHQRREWTISYRKTTHAHASHAGIVNVDDGANHIK